MIARTKIILGPPGTGKTTRLLDIMEQEFNNGCQPDRMVYCSFTKKAVEEARERACDRFNFTNTDMIYFRTVHSLAFTAMGLSRNKVMSANDYKKIGHHLGMEFSKKEDFFADGLISGKHKGDRYSFIHGFQRARMMSHKDAWDSVNHEQLNWYEYLRYCDTLDEYKKMKGLYDFSDMISMMQASLDVDVVIIDEAQDLSTAQWHMLLKATEQAQRIYIGGDDDQAIYSWGGADVKQFLSIDGDKEVLHQSYRIPKSVHTLAQQLTSKIKYRADKQYLPQNKSGSVEYWRSLDHLEMCSGSWLLLARNTYLLKEIIASVRQKGVVYAVRGQSTIGADHVRAITRYEQWRKGRFLNPTDLEIIAEFCPKMDAAVIWHEAFTKMYWEDKEYYISLLRRGESLTKNPRINISTIHGVKGGEADHVAILTDMAFSTWEATTYDQDAEHRVWYVGATRCKESLNIILPRGRYHYDL